MSQPRSRHVLNAEHQVVEAALDAQEQGDLAAMGTPRFAETSYTGIGFGLALFIAGSAIALNHVQHWILLGQICLVIGALMFGGGVIAYHGDMLASMLIVTGTFLLAACCAGSPTVPSGCISAKRR